MRLQMDAIATGSAVAIVRTTQPITTAQAYTALGRSVARKQVTPPEAGKTIPIELKGGTCSWIPLDSLDAGRDRDQMVVQLSSPVPNPFVPGAAGVFARVSLGGEHPSWYWVALNPRGTGWTIGALTSLDAR